MNEDKKTGLREDLIRDGYSKEEQYFSKLNHELIQKLKEERAKERNLKREKEKNEKRVN